MSVTIEDLQRAHVERQEEWCPDQKPDLSFRGNEMGGECGEAQNVIKKLERERHGWRGSRDTLDHLGEELADVVHTAILCAITAGLELGPFVVRKFNSTSEKNALRTRVAGATHRHKKRGSEYELLGAGKMQSEEWKVAHRYRDMGEWETDMVPVDMSDVAVYRSVDDASLWVRPLKEFEDGRFVALQDIAA